MMAMVMPIAMVILQNVINVYPTRDDECKYNRNKQSNRIKKKINLALANGSEYTSQCPFKNKNDVKKKIS